MLIYMAKGRLPWQHLLDTPRDSRNRTLSKEKRLQRFEVLKMKRSIEPRELCRGLGDPFRQLLEYALKLKYDECPNYDWLRGLVWAHLKKNWGGARWDKLDWVCWGTAPNQPAATTTTAEPSHASASASDTQPLTVPGITIPDNGGDTTAPVPRTRRHKRGAGGRRRTHGAAAPGTKPQTAASSSNSTSTTSSSPGGTSTARRRHPTSTAARHRKGRARSTRVPREGGRKRGN